MSATPRGYAKDQAPGFVNHVEKVAIVGAGGQMGKHITEHLIAGGNHVITAITRPDSTSKMPEGLHVVQVNYASEADDDVTALVDALRGQQALIITMNVMSLGAIKNLVHAAAKANVAYILPNWYGHDGNNEKLIRDSLMSGLLDNSREIEKLGVSSYVLLACNFWYEYSLGGGPDRYGFDFKKRSFTLFDGGNVAINTSTWPQCGRAVVNLFSLKQLPDDENDKVPSLAQFCNSCVYISSFRLSQCDMFESVKRVTETTDADWTISDDNTEQRWKMGMKQVKNGDHRGWAKMGYSRMFFPNGDGDYETSRGLHNDVLGLTGEDLDEVTKEGIRLGETGAIWP